MKSRLMNLVLGLLLVLTVLSGSTFAASCINRTEKSCCGVLISVEETTKPTPPGPIDPVHGKPIVSVDSPGQGFWGVGLNYAGLYKKWETGVDVRLVKETTTQVWFYPDAYVAMEYQWDSGNSEWDSYGDDGEEVFLAHILTGDISVDDYMYTYHKTSNQTTTYKFYGFNGTWNASLEGKLESVQIGGTDEKVTYAYDGNYNVSTATDGLGRVVTYQYDSDKLYKIIESNPADSTPKSNTHGRVTWFHWDSDNIVRMDVGMPKTVEADPGTSATDDPDIADYIWRRTAFTYDDDDQLTYIIPPEQYDAWTASTESDKDDKYATSKFVYYPTGHDDAGKVKRETYAGCGRCGGGLGLGIEYTYLQDDDEESDTLTTLYIDGTPTGQNLPAYQLNIHQWEGGKRELGTIQQMNTNHQLLFLLKRATGNTGWLKAITYDSDRRPTYLKEYEVEFDWNDPPSAASYDSGDQFAGQQFTYDGERRREYDKVWNGSSYVNVRQRTYTAAGSRLVEDSIADPDTLALTTTYCYDSDSRVELVAYAQVDSDQNSYYSGEDYYLGVRTTYDNYGRVTEERKMRLSNTPADWDTETGETELRSVKYYYADSDSLDNDGDSSTDEADGSESFELTRVVVDDKGEGDDLDLETRYAYDIIAGVWRKTSQIVDPGDSTHLNLTTTYDYTTHNPLAGAWGNPTTITAPDGVTIAVSDYDEADRLISATQTQNGAVLSRSTTYYCKYGKVLSTTQAAGFPEERSTINEYDEAGRLAKVYSNVADLVWKNGSWTGNVLGNVVNNNYIPGTKRVATVGQKAGWAACAPTTIAATTYRVDGKRLTSTDASGNITTYTYGEEGRLETVADALGDETTYSHDILGRLEYIKQYDGDASTGTLMAQSKNVYDNLGRVIESITYSASEPGSQSFTTEYYYDPVGNHVKVEDPGDNATEYTYDDADRLYKVEDALENVTFTTYDPAGRTIVTVLRHKIDAVPTYRRELVINYYDDLGRTTHVANWGTNEPTDWSWGTEPVAWNYDKIPASAGTSDDDHLVTAYDYGIDSELGIYRRVTDPAGIQSASHADKLGRTTRTVESADAIDRVTLYAYDLAVEGKGYRKNTITAKNEPNADQVTAYVRADCMDVGRVTSTIYPDVGEVVVSYNANGRVADRVDQRNWKTAYTYDELGRVTQEDITALGAVAVVGTATVAYEYDALGRLTKVTDDNGTNDDSEITYAYTWISSSTDQQAVATQKIGGSTMGVVTTKVNDEGERTYLQYPNSRELTFAYDALHRLDTIIDTGVTLADYDYKGLYLQDRKLNADALRLTFKDSTDLDGYDDWGRIDWMQHKDTDGGEIVELSYGHDYAGNPLYQRDELDNTNRSELYGYGNLHRLLSFKRGQLNEGNDAIDSPNFYQDWTLDKLGNWSELDDDGTDDERLHDPANKISLPGGGSAPARSYNSVKREVTYDSTGNTTSIEGNDGTTTYRYTYDYRNRLVQVESRTTGAYSTDVQYVYDGLNRRVKKDLTTGTDVVYLYDGWRCIEEREDDSGWEARRQYVYGEQYIDEVLIFDIDTNDDGDCTEAEGTGSTRYLYCANANFNVLALADNAGAVAERYKYEPYGTVTVTLDDSSGNPFRFQGRRWTSEANLYYFRMRDHSPTLGRFNQSDPLGYADTMSLYQFVGANPVVATDPMGEKKAHHQSGINIHSFPPRKRPTAFGKQCGGASLLVVFQLNAKAPKKMTGAIIQHVKQRVQVTDCDDKPIPYKHSPATKDFPDPKNIEFWEAWPVTKGVISFGYGSDSWSTPSQGWDTCGLIEITAEVNLFDKYKVLKKPKGEWGTLPISGSLPATTKQPAIWNSKGARKRSMTIEWKCCPDEYKPTMITTVP